MSIEIALWNDILPVLRENFKLWTPGLSPQRYRHYIWSQLHTTWSRQNLTYICWRERGRLAASCKLYRLNFSAHSHSFALAGISAVFTQEEFRGRGIAKKFMHALIDQCKREHLDGVLLFSDIGSPFYKGLGFQAMGGADFAIYLPEKTRTVNSEKAILRSKNERINRFTTLSNAPDQLDHCQFSPGIGEPVLEEMVRHYMRWLSRQPFGISRNTAYFAYKLARERFITINSKLSWPVTRITTFNSGGDSFGYALTEHGGVTMRVLEVIGSTSARAELWQDLCDQAMVSGIRRIRGWESVVRDFAPGFSCPFLQAEQINMHDYKIHAFERDWGKPMLFIFNKALSNWPHIVPCPILELDHL